MTVPGLIRKFALESGISEESIDIFACPKEATEQALMNALPGDLLVLLALTQRQEALALIHEYLKANNG